MGFGFRNLGFPRQLSDLLWISALSPAIVQHVSLRLPFADVDRRTAWLRGILLSACFLGLLASVPVWTNTHGFPMLPIARWFPILPSPLDKVLFGMMLLALAVAAWFYRAAVSFFLFAGLFVFCEDQNRGQPWFYMYWVMLLLTLLPSATAIAACRCAVSAAYIWGGIQKFNPRFFEVVPRWFVAPATHWHLPSAAIDLLRWAVAAAPFVELAIGLLLWVPRLRWWTLGGTLAVHLSALLFLGPLGYNYNWVVWPWNLAMIALVGCLLAPGIGTTGAREAFFTRSLAELRRSKLALIVVGLYAFLPVFSYAGWWDSYFSFSLYAENAANANIFVTPAFRNRLPPPMRAHVNPFPQAYDPAHQGPLVFAFQAWGYEAMRVPPIPEPRNFRSIFRFLRKYSKEPGDLRMIVGQRAGRVIFLEGDRTELLKPK